MPSVAPVARVRALGDGGHLFAYEAALAIDAAGRPSREARAAIEAAVEAEVSDDALLWWLTPRSELRAGASSTGCARTPMTDTSEASTAVRVASLMRYATTAVPLDVYEMEHGRAGTPSAVIEDLSQALTGGRGAHASVDEIKHQAKTVTVGISGSDQTLLAVPLVQAVLDAGAPAIASAHRALRKLGVLDPAIDAVTGFTWYRIDGDADG